MGPIRAAASRMAGPLCIIIALLARTRFHSDLSKTRYSAAKPISEGRRRPDATSKVNTTALDRQIPWSHTKANIPSASSSFINRMQCASARSASTFSISGPWSSLQKYTTNPNSSIPMQLKTLTDGIWRSATSFSQYVAALSLKAITVHSALSLNVCVRQLNWCGDRVVPPRLFRTWYHSVWM
jgi:hypothetical protein